MHKLLQNSRSERKCRKLRLPEDSTHCVTGGSHWRMRHHLPLSRKVPWLPFCVLYCGTHGGRNVSQLCYHFQHPKLPVLLQNASYPQQGTSGFHRIYAGRLRKFLCACARYPLRAGLGLCSFSSCIKFQTGLVTCLCRCVSCDPF